MKSDRNGMGPRGFVPRLSPRGIPPGALESEVLAVNYAKRRPPVYNRTKGMTWSQRPGAFLRRQFDGREKELWDPDFQREWLEYVEAVERGELRGYL